jgi:hypothetical protein
VSTASSHSTQADQAGTCCATSLLAGTSLASCAPHASLLLDSPAHLGRDDAPQLQPLLAGCGPRRFTRCLLRLLLLLLLTLTLLLLLLLLLGVLLLPRCAQVHGPVACAGVLHAAADHMRAPGARRWRRASLQPLVHLLCVGAAAESARTMWPPAVQPGWSSTRHPCARLTCVMSTHSSSMPSFSVGPHLHGSRVWGVCVVACLPCSGHRGPHPRQVCACAVCAVHAATRPTPAQHRVYAPAGRPVGAEVLPGHKHQARAHPACVLDAHQPGGGVAHADARVCVRAPRRLMVAQVHGAVHNAPQLTW